MKKKHLKKRIKNLRKALEFYARQYHYVPVTAGRFTTSTFVNLDGGSKARTVLCEDGKED